MDDDRVIGTVPRAGAYVVMMRLVPVFVLLFLAGCATGPSREQVLASLVGKPESDALRVLGAPNRTLDANGHKFLAFDDIRTGYVPPPYFGPFGFFGYGYFGSPGYPVVDMCQTTLEIVNGRVASYSLRGNAC